MIVAGFGCRPGAATDDFLSALAEALNIAQCDASTLACVAFPHFRAAEAATTLSDLPVAIIGQPALEQACLRAETHSARTFAHTGLTSVAESAALAAAGPGSRLLVRRIGAGSVTCAIAIGERPA
ncbi:cobalt-precorrin 5A hydrolase [Sphingomonas sp. YR710]|uniref:cobalamin biosynthesis protein n=1 Tax=Sphingomonas sp. YR710 TaxID=1882773 RepID=UPI000890F07F|nr:cobalamin biosynthesis protein [Sphingomonas sp. YR710]SDC82064.1 cobalt-precorrin 5A hydrolase [Sphingomonas sp. YR710]